MRGDCTVSNDNDLRSNWRSSFMRNMKNTNFHPKNQNTVFRWFRDRRASSKRLQYRSYLWLIIRNVIRLTEVPTPLINALKLLTNFHATSAFILDFFDSVWSEQIFNRLASHTSSRKKVAESIELYPYRPVIKQSLDKKDDYCARQRWQFGAEGPSKSFFAIRKS